LEDIFDVILIDKKPYFQVTPTLPSLVTTPTNITKCRAEHTRYLGYSRVILGEVKEVFANPQQVVLANGEKIQYDYLVIASGSHYEIPFRPASTSNSDMQNMDTMPDSQSLSVSGHESTVTLTGCGGGIVVGDVVDASNSAEVFHSYTKLASAHKICVVGSGPTAIEFSAEIASSFPDKEITVITRSSELLSRMNLAVHNLVLNVFSQNFPKVKFIFRETVQAFVNHQVITDRGSIIDSELIYACLGFKPSTSFLVPNLSHCLNSAGYIEVNESLQVGGNPNIYACGDVVDLLEEKLARNALLHAEVVAKNISRTEQGLELRLYQPNTRLMIVSLGPSNAILVNGANVISEGVIASKLRSLVELSFVLSKRTTS